jgi:glycosyltransferase involved in cell wall biosynthesis
MSSPRVSVIIPCFNLGQYLDEAVDSVLAQTYSDFEVIVIDDGSTDETTRRLLDGYDRPSTRVIRSANRGLPAAKNLGLAHSTGEFVSMLDADDRLDPAFLEKSVAALDRAPALTFVSHWLRTFGDEVRDWTPTECDFPSLLDANTVNGAALVRRSALDLVGGFDESMRNGCEDWDIWITLVERGLQGCILPEVLFYYRQRPGSMSRVMVQGDGHARLYRRLAEKHPQSFAAHAKALIKRRERDISVLRRHVHDLDLEHYLWLGPELDKRRDDAAVLGRKKRRADEDRERREREAEKDRLQALMDREVDERERAHIAQIADHEASLRAAERELSRFRKEVGDLRTSWSWRLTSPLRAIYETIWKPGKRNS